MSLRRIRALLVVLSLVGTVLLSPVGPNVHASPSEFINDSPVRSGSPWYNGTAGDGYGTNNFHYAYVKGSRNYGGDLITSDVSAYWDFTDIHASHCRVDVYVPAKRATADVYYHIFEGDTHVTSVLLDQEDYTGWTTLTTLELEGSIRIYLLNYEWSSYTPTIDSRGYQYNRYGVDAMKLVCTTIVAPAAIINDSPVRSGSPWYNGTAGDGYGTNNFHYAYVKGSRNYGGDLITSDVSAYWDFNDIQASRCRVDVYVPANRATADVYYHIFEGDTHVTSVLLDQEDYTGWTTLTTLELEGSIKIYLLNYEWRGYTPAIDSRGYRYNRYGVDASRLQCGQAIVPIVTVPIATIDDYNAAVDGRATGAIDDWNMIVGECTSFVAWRMNDVNNVRFTNQYRGVERWGNAYQWDETARSLSILVNRTPAVGSIAQWDRRNNLPCAAPHWDCGHVAYVDQIVGPNEIVVSDMNFNTKRVIRAAHTYTKSADDEWPFEFIHIKDL